MATGVLAVENVADAAGGTRGFIRRYSAARLVMRPSTFGFTPKAALPSSSICVQCLSASSSCRLLKLLESPRKDLAACFDERSLRAARTHA